MFHQRHQRLIGGVAAISLLGLAACGGDGSGEGDLGSEEGEIVYSYWGGTPRAEQVQEVIRLFHDQHEDITVSGELAEYNPYFERLTVRAAGGDLACATGMQSTQMERYARSGTLRPLEPYIEEGLIDVSGLTEEILESGQVDGVQYLIPTGTFLRIPTYNSVLLEEAGVEPPLERQTWEEYGDWLREIQAGLPEGIYASDQEGTNFFTFASWVVGHGEEVFEDGGLGFDRQLLIDWFDYWVELNEDGVTLPPSRLGDQIQSPELMPMSTGDLAVGTFDIPHMYIGEQALARQGIETTIEPLTNPSNIPDLSTNILGANGISIPESCNEGAAAARFIDFFTNDVEAGLAFLSDNGVVTNSRVQEALLEEPDVPEGVRQNIELLSEFTEAGDAVSMPYPEGYGSLNTELRRQFEDVIFGRTSTEDAADQFFAEAERALS